MIASKKASEVRPYAMRTPRFAFSRCDPSRSIAVCRPQAEVLGRRLDGKCGVAIEQAYYSHVVIRAGDH